MECDLALPPAKNAECCQFLPMIDKISCDRLGISFANLCFVSIVRLTMSDTSPTAGELSPLPSSYGYPLSFKDSIINIHLNLIKKLSFPHC